MPNAVHAWFGKAARFPKQSTSDLRWLKNAYVIFGIGTLLLSLIWFPGWQTAAWVVVTIGWFYQSALARKEIRRREAETALSD
ncbi:hypothetical protein [Pseudarthrobacter sp. IC2-21]|uniref:hypothetical protein n=1 Tax=Pseudarthrobacter sp. IC2-21 TaxID=3092262 RepID=UPI002A6A7E6F|nr:hypothetical protein [Pseudarthrobacter sp. IC2-21]